MYLILYAPGWKLLKIVLSRNIDWNNLFISEQKLLEYLDVIDFKSLGSLKAI